MFKGKLSHGKSLSYGFTDRRRKAYETWIVGQCYKPLKTAASKDEDPAALAHQGKPYCTVTAKASAQATANEKISPNFKISAGKLPRHRICRRKLIQVPYGHYNSKVRNHLYGVDENLDSITLAGFGSLLTKIPFSYRSTEVYGILIVMKIPTERSRSWGLRSNPWLLIGEVREVFYTSTLILGACTSEHLGDSIVLTLMGKLNMILVLIW